MSPEPGTLAFWFGYRWFLVRHKIACWRREWPWLVAMRLPRRVALMAFVRVYAVIGRCDPNYAEIYDEWERRSAGGKPPAWPGAEAIQVAQYEPEPPSIGPDVPGGGAVA